MAVEKTLNAGQAKLILEVAKRAYPKLTPAEWDEISQKVGSTSGRTVKERLRQLIAKFDKSDGNDAASPQKLKGTTLTKRATKGGRKASAKKPMTEERKKQETEEESSEVDAAGYDEDVDEDEDEDEDEEDYSTP